MTAKFPDLALQCITQCAESLEYFTGSVVKACSFVGLHNNWDDQDERLSMFIEVLCSKINFDALNPVPRLKLAELLSDFLKSSGFPKETTSQLVVAWVHSIVERGAEECQSDYKETEKLILSAFYTLPTSIIMTNPPEFFKALLSFALIASSEDKSYLDVAKVFVTVMFNVEEGVGFLHSCLSELLGNCLNAEILIQQACESFDDEGEFSRNVLNLISALRDISNVYHYNNKFI